MLILTACSMRGLIRTPIQFGRDGILETTHSKLVSGSLPQQMIQIIFLSS